MPFTAHKGGKENTLITKDKQRIMTELLGRGPGEDLSILGEAAA